MLRSILNLNGVQSLNKQQQQAIKAGGWPTNEEDCYLCGGISWTPTPLNGGLCELSWDSVCL